MAKQDNNPELLTPAEIPYSEDGESFDEYTEGMLYDIFLDGAKAQLAKSQRCPECKGEKEVWVDVVGSLSNYAKERTSCPTCQGTGKRDRPRQVISETKKRPDLVFPPEYYEPDKPKFNNVLEADAHNWDTRELDRSGLRAKMGEIADKCYKDNPYCDRGCKMFELRKFLDQIIALFDEEGIRDKLDQARIDIAELSKKLDDREEDLITAKDEERERILNCIWPVVRGVGLLSGRISKANAVKLFGKEWGRKARQALGEEVKGGKHGVISDTEQGT